MPKARVQFPRLSKKLRIRPDEVEFFGSRFRVRGFTGSRFHRFRCLAVSWGFVISRVSWFHEFPGFIHGFRSLMSYVVS